MSLIKEIRFYQMDYTQLEDILPRMLQLVLERHSRAVVILNSEERVAQLDRHLWIYAQHSFLPHGTSDDGDAENQPIWLTHTDERPNHADYLFLCEGAMSHNIHDFAVISLLFSGNNPQTRQEMHQLWQRWSHAGYVLRYWRRSEQAWLAERAPGEK